VTAPSTAALDERGASAASAAPSYEAYAATERFASLDGLRCLSILPVIWHHSTPRPPSGFLGRGPLGVHLFFALSGFLITTLLLRERRRTGTVSLGRFYARRSLRIFPLYYLVLALYTARALWLLPPSPMRSHFLGNVPWFATYTTNWLVDFEVPHPVIFGFSWSLATEEQFYLLWPWVFRVTRSLALPVAFMSALLLLDAVAERGLLSPLLEPHGVGIRIVTSLSAPIGLGALLACALDTPRAHRVVSVFLARRSSAPVLLALLGALVVWDGAPLLAIHLTMVSLVAAVCLRPDHGLRALLEAPPVRYVGKISYGMYLLHVASITFVKLLLPATYGTPGVIFPLATAITIGLAALSHRTFESRFLALRARFAAR
jgi:peptidoglycan/LPS O-acetylase OafA/YrhL